MGEMNVKKERRKLVFAITLMLVLMAALTIISWPYIRKLNDPEVRQRFSDWIAGLGFWGVIIILAIQCIQIIIAFIPGGPMEIIAGAAYGIGGGLLICLAGCIIASSLVFLVVRKYGYPLVNRIFGEKVLEKYRFLRDAKKIEYITFILFLIPGTPKDMLTYMAGVSPIQMFRFIAISVFARTPAILMSVIIGSNMIKGNWLIFLPIFVLTAVLGILGLKYRDRIIGIFRKK